MERAICQPSKRSTDQGRAFDSLSLHPDSSYFTYTGAFLSFYQYRFVHKARLYLLPVRTVQARCRKLVPQHTVPPLWEGRGDPLHTSSITATNIWGWCENGTTLFWIGLSEQSPAHLGTKMKEQAIPGTSGASRPDLTIISPGNSSIILVEVCCPFEGSPNALEDAARSKMDIYEPLRQVLLERYTSVEILPFIVGSLGSWYPPNDRVLSRLHIGWRYASLMRRLCVMSAIAGSQLIWCRTMCTQRHMPLRDGEPRDDDAQIDSATVRDGTAVVQGGPATIGEGPATAHDGGPAISQ